MTDLKEEIKQRTGLDDAEIAAGKVGQRVRELKEKSARNTKALVELEAANGKEIKRSGRDGEPDMSVEAPAPTNVSEMSTMEVEFNRKRGLSIRDHSDNVKGVDVMHIENQDKAHTDQLGSKEDKESVKEWKEKTGNQTVYLKQKAASRD